MVKGSRDVVEVKEWPKRFTRNRIQVQIYLVLSLSTAEVGKPRLAVQKWSQSPGPLGETTLAWASFAKCETVPRHSISALVDFYFLVA